MDELADKLKELAQRQQQEAERQRRMAAAGQNSSGGGAVSVSSPTKRKKRRGVSSSSRATCRARTSRIWRVSSSSRGRDAARGGQRIARRRRAGAAGARQAASGGNDQLTKGQTNRTKENIQDAQRQAEALAASRRISRTRSGSSIRRAPAGAQGQKLIEQKTAMGEKLAGLEKQLQQLTDETRRNERDASRKLAEAGGTIRSKQLKELIDYTKRAIQAQLPDYAQQAEPVISSNLDALARRSAKRPARSATEQKQASSTARSTGRAIWCAAWSRSISA